MYTTATVSYITGKPEQLTGDKQLLHVYAFLLARTRGSRKSPRP
jgi:hypothetical protein